MTELEQEIFDYIKQRGVRSERHILVNFSTTFKRDTEIRQALANLIAAGMVQGSAEMPVRYSVTRLED